MSFKTVNTTTQPATANAAVATALSANNCGLQKAKYKSFNKELVIHKKLKVGALKSVYEKEAGFIATRIRMPEQNFIQRKCVQCEEEEKAQRKLLAPFIQKNETIDNNIKSDAISNQIQSTKGNGNTISATTKSFMENRFGADFSNVKIHTGNYASQLSKELNAQAFTVGNDIYFNEGKYQPESNQGKYLLAHELTHTLQQSPLKLSRSISCEGNPTAPPRAAQGSGRNAIDARAQAIIDIAAGSDPVPTKAINIVTQIICQYFPSQAVTVNSVRHDAHLASGLETQSSGSAASSTGIIKVSNQFVTDTNAPGIARRVLQVGHELQHIQQYRSGLGGQPNKPEREFLAFYDESLGDEFEGTGRLQQGTRLNLVDEAIRNYFCLSATLQTQYASRLTNLRTRRQAIIATGRVRNPGTEPTSC
jgi:hypothetical protein